MLNNGISEKTVNETWKPISKHSERQLGAFIIIHAQAFGQPPLLMKSNNVEFRNDVIHQGKIPNRHEAVNYGQAVLDVLRPSLKQLKGKCSEGIQKAIFHHLKNSRTSEDDKQLVSTMWIRTIVNLHAGKERNEQTLEKALSELRRLGYKG